MLNDSIEFALESLCVVAKRFGHAISGGEVTDLSKGIIGHQERRATVS